MEIVANEVPGYEDLWEDMQDSLREEDDFVSGEDGTDPDNPFRPPPRWRRGAPVPEVFRADHLHELGQIFAFARGNPHLDALEEDLLADLTRIWFEHNRGLVLLSGRQARKTDVIAAKVGFRGELASVK